MQRARLARIQQEKPSIVAAYCMAKNQRKLDRNDGDKGSPPDDVIVFYSVYNFPFIHALN